MEEVALDFVSALARTCAHALGESVVGVILHGSLVLGDYVPGRSDGDRSVVVEGPLEEAELVALGEAVERVAPHAPGRADVRVVTREVAAAPSRLPPLEASVEIGRWVHVEGRNPGERDLAIELSVCRVHGRSLVGPAPAELIGEVPARWVVEVGDEQLADWQAIGDDPEYAELTVLTACRIWRFAEEGVHCSKAEAGGWALARDPELGVVRDALQRGEAPHVIDAVGVSRLLGLCGLGSAIAGDVAAWHQHTVDRTVALSTARRASTTIELAPTWQPHRRWSGSRLSRTGRSARRAGNCFRA